MKFEHTTLENGLKVVTVQLREAQSISVNIFAGVGSRHEEFSRNGGVSHFLEHLLFKGSTKRPSPNLIAEAIDNVGGSGNAYTSHELTSFYIKVPNQHMNLALDILSDMVKNPTFAQDEVDRERNVVVEEMNVERDDPARYVYDLLPPLLWPHDPLGREIIGSEAVIRSISREDILSYQQRYYNPQNMVVAVAGSKSHEEVVEQVRAMMGDMKAKKPAAPVFLNSELSPELVNVLSKETNQAHIMIGCQSYPYNDPNDMAARVATNLLGSGMSSRLFVNVRERLGLAYSVYAYYSNFIDTGLFSVYAGVSLDKVDEAIKQILVELELVRTEPVKEEELTKVKNKMSGGLQMALENTFAIADRAGTRLLLLNQIKTPEETLAEIDAVTASDVLRVAKEMLDPSRLRMAVISPDPSSAAAKFKSIIEGSYAKR